MRQVITLPFTGEVTVRPGRVTCDAVHAMPPQPQLSFGLWERSLPSVITAELEAGEIKERPRAPSASSEAYERTNPVCRVAELDGLFGREAAVSGSRRQSDEELGHSPLVETLTGQIGRNTVAL